MAGAGFGGASDPSMYAMLIGDTNGTAIAEKVKGLKALNLGGNEFVMHITAFTTWTLGVAILTAFIVSKCMPKSADASEDFFSGGRSLKWYVIAGSLMLTNLSTEQLVGLNGTIFMDGCMSGIAWESGAAVTMCITAIVFLPVYAVNGLSTTAGFLGERFDPCIRTVVSCIFLVFYAVVTCPMVLYTGALAVQDIFDLQDIPLSVLSTLIGFLGAIYALTGGLKAVAVSDCLNGVGLIFFGVWVPFRALSMCGGISALFDDKTLLQPLRSEGEIWSNDEHARAHGPVSVPWSVLFTGMLVNNIYYWATNQLIVQRVLGAESLAHGQKGVLFAATLKVIGFSFLCLPGLIGVIMVNKGVLVDGKPFEIEKNDEVYPLVVKACMPTWSLGVFSAVLLGSVLSTFNSALNSSSTLFGLEIYKVYMKPDATPENVVKVATYFGIALSLFSFVAAPLLANVGSIFGYLQKISAVCSLPIVTCFFIGIFTTLPDAFAVKVGFIIGLALYGGFQFLATPHWLHLYFIAFIVASAFSFVATYFEPLRKLFGKAVPPEEYVFEEGKAVVDVTNWKFMKPYSGAIVALVVVCYVALQTGSQGLFYSFWALWACCFLILVVLPVGQSAFKTAESDDEIDGTEDDE